MLKSFNQKYWFILNFTSVWNETSQVFMQIVAYLTSKSKQQLTFQTSCLKCFTMQPYQAKLISWLFVYSLVVFAC